ncbi:uncharacterized protein LOC114306046 isoform X2 [Camellia sinensis]|uniref:uncharacterized protein LOC114306046 isoform X2 n=1 Tax=Camellia sinensis TaxID=4442 RepID=UPI0010358C73|nr:uncharacterized protein LOC114306046 isoform X2 [Camellia sinensis]
MVRFSFFFINGFLIIFIAERQSRVAIVVKATGESSESSTSLSVVKSVQNVNPGVPPVAASKLSPLPPEPVDYDRGPTVNIPLDNGKVN